jgi:hypothetical protein
VTHASRTCQRVAALAAGPVPTLRPTAITAPPHKHTHTHTHRRWGGKVGGGRWWWPMHAPGLWRSHHNR